MTPKLSILLVEDNRLFCQGFANLLRTIGQVKVVFTAYHSDEAFLLLEAHKFDLVFLDLELHGSRCNGFEICSQIKMKQGEIVVAILSMYDGDGCVKNAKLCGANAFFDKDVEPEVLMSFILNLKKFKRGYFIDGRVEKDGKMRKDWLEKGLEFVGDKMLEVLVVSDADKNYFIKLYDIVSVEASNSQSVIYTRDGCGLAEKIVVSKSLKEIEERLPKQSFVRVHKSWLAHLYHVNAQTKEGGYRLIMTNKSEVPVAKRLAKDILDLVFSFYKTGS